MKEPDDDILKDHGFAENELLRNALLELNNLKKPTSTATQAWSLLESSIRAKENQKGHKRTISMKLFWSVAASIILLIGLSFSFYYWNRVQFMTGNKQQFSAILPDNTTVKMNAGTSLSYHRFGWTSSRKVQLSGEAFFKVRKGTPFEIHTYGKTITVLGTEFNVYSRKDYFEVKCISGKVAVQIKGNDKLFLTKGQGIRQGKNNAVPVSIVADEQTSSWVKGEFYYKNADLKMVLEELARQYNIVVILSGNDRKYSGYFSNKDLHQAMENICLPMGLSYTINKDSILIK